MDEIIDLNKYRQEKQSKDDRKNAIDFQQKRKEIKDNATPPISQKEGKGDVLDFEGKKFLKDWADFKESNDGFLKLLETVKKEEYLPHLESLNKKSRDELLEIIEEGLKQKGHKPYLKAVVEKLTAIAEKLAREYAKERKIKKYAELIKQIEDQDFDEEVINREIKNLKEGDELDLWDILETNLATLQSIDVSAVPLFRLYAIIKILKEKGFL